MSLNPCLLLTCALLAGPLADPKEAAQQELRAGNAKALTGHLEAAMAHATRALQLDPDLVDAHKILGMGLARQQKFCEAREHYLTVLASNPNKQVSSAIRKTLSAESYRSCGPLMVAPAEQLSRVVTAEEHLTLSKLRFVERRFSDSLAEALAAMEGMPTSAKPRMAAAVALRMMDRPCEAKTRYLEALEREADEQRVREIKNTLREPEFLRCGPPGTRDK